jgi:hypothetical protein
MYTRVFFPQQGNYFRALPLGFRELAVPLGGVGVYWRTGVLEVAWVALKAPTHVDGVSAKAVLAFAEPSL